MKYGEKDFKVGDVLTTKNGNKYALVVDSNGNWGAILCHTNDGVVGVYSYLSFDVEGNLYVSRKPLGKKIVVRAERSLAENDIDSLSEALKYITKRNFNYMFKVIFELGPKESSYEEIFQKMKEEGITLADLQRKLMQ